MGITCSCRLLVSGGEPSIPDPDPDYLPHTLPEQKSRTGKWTIHGTKFLRSYWSYLNPCFLIGPHWAGDLCIKTNSGLWMVNIFPLPWDIFFFLGHQCTEERCGWHPVTGPGNVTQICEHWAPITKKIKWRFSIDWWKKIKYKESLEWIIRPCPVNWHLGLVAENEDVTVTMRWWWCTSLGHMSPHVSTPLHPPSSFWISECVTLTFWQPPEVARKYTVGIKHLNLNRGGYHRGPWWWGAWGAQSIRCRGSQNCIREIPGPMLLPVQHLHYPSHQILLMQEFPLAVLSLPQPLVCFKVKLDNDQRLDPIPVKNRQSPRSKVQLQFNRWKNQLVHWFGGKNSQEQCCLLFSFQIAKF